MWLFSIKCLIIAHTAVTAKSVLIWKETKFNQSSMEEELIFIAHLTH